MAYLGFSQLRGRQPPSDSSRSEGRRCYGYHFSSAHHSCSPRYIRFYQIVSPAKQYVSGFFRSIALRSENALQDTLRLLTLWFKFGAHDEVSHAIASGFSTVEVDTWLEVIPQVSCPYLSFSTPVTYSIQIIARIQTPNPNIRRNITSLLTDVGKHHPQALVYPLTVASKSPSALRKDAALAIMDRMKQHSPAIVEQVRQYT